MTHQTVGEEIANSIVHALGAALAVASLATLVTLAALRGDARHVVGCAVFGAALVAMFTSSTLYHATTNRRVKGVLRVIDHSAIYLAIAGTYTPFVLVSLRGAWRWTLLGVVWGAAAAGIAIAATISRRLGALRVAIYVAMGWVGIVAFRPLLASLGTGGMGLVIGGGLVYTLGVAVYAWRGLRYHHAVWHAFVLGGSALHVLAVLWYVIPRPPGS